MQQEAKVRIDYEDGRVFVWDGKVHVKERRTEIPPTNAPLHTIDICVTLKPEEGR